MILLLFLILVIILLCILTKMTLSVIGGALGIVIVLFAYLLKRRMNR